jgi:hypothetical protein
MRTLSIRLAVALVTFVVGLKLAWVFAALFAPALSREEVREIRVAPVVKVRSCPTSQRRLDVPPPPPLPPAPPAVAEPSSSKKTRVVIRRSDGTVQVIETHSGTKTKD